MVRPQIQIFNHSPGPVMDSCFKSSLSSLLTYQLTWLDEGAKRGTCGDVSIIVILRKVCKKKYDKLQKQHFIWPGCSLTKHLSITRCKKSIKELLSTHDPCRSHLLPEFLKASSFQVGFWYNRMISIKSFFLVSAIYDFLSVIKKQVC